MPRSGLSESEVEDFRSRLCDAAARLFAQHGYAGVTLRALARELGCSPMTPYRYFRDKGEIFAAVRAAAFRRFADAQREAFESHADPEVRLGALADAYVSAARRDPHGYRLMFDMTEPASAPSAELAREQSRAHEFLWRAVALAIDAGALAGDPDSVAQVFWAGYHGMVSLELAGEVKTGRRLEALVSPMEDTLIEGNRPRTRRKGDRAAP